MVYDEIPKIVWLKFATSPTPTSSCIKPCNETKFNRDEYTARPSLGGHNDL